MSHIFDYYYPHTLPSSVVDDELNILGVSDLDSTRDGIDRTVANRSSIPETASWYERLSHAGRSPDCRQGCLKHPEKNRNLPGGSVIELSSARDTSKGQSLTFACHIESDSDDYIDRLALLLLLLLLSCIHLKVTTFFSRRLCQLLQT